MKKTDLLFVCLLLCGLIGIIVGSALWDRYRYEETASFAKKLEETFKRDLRFATLQVFPSTARTIDIMGPVANTNLVSQLKDEVLALDPPVHMVARLYVGESGSSFSEDLGKIVTWEIAPGGASGSSRKRRLKSADGVKSR